MTTPTAPAPAMAKPSHELELELPLELEHTGATTSSRSTTAKQKSQRVLACSLCRRRKIKCDHKFPCANCVRAGAQCVPANPLAAHQRRRRFPERDLLGRLRYCEGLLRQHGVNFEPWLPSATAPGAEHASPSDDGRASSDSLDDPNPDASGDKTTSKSHEAIDLWRAIRRATLDPDDDHDDDSEGDGEVDGNTDGGDTSNLASVDGSHRAPRSRGSRAPKKAWTQRFQSDVDDQSGDHLLFLGPPRDNNLSTSHPGQVQMFRLWQIYLDNVNPLLKVTHTPTLQSRIIDAASDVATISPALEALIFSIYCVSIVSLAEDDCLALFHSPRRDLLASYQDACQQALRKCGAWRSGDTESLTALYLYLVSVRSQTDARSLSCMLAVAIRIAQRMGMHNESSYGAFSTLEAEMRRRLWWSLVFFDHRICEVADYRTTTLTPVWDCNTPLNVNDFELRPDMKSPPPAHDKPTEALFAVVRSELADSLRHSAFHLNFVNPSLNAIAQLKHSRQGASATPEGELIALEKNIEDKYLAFCNPEDPLHFMTIWTTRGFLARNRLLEHYSKHSTSASVRPTDSQRVTALSYALSMLECDTKLRTSPLTKGYLWLVDFHPPALAYLHILNDMRKRPADEHAGRSWDVIGDNYEALMVRLRQNAGSEQGVYRIFVVFSRVILQAWEAREALLRQQNKPPEQPPRLVEDIRGRIAPAGFSPAQSVAMEYQGGGGGGGGCGAGDAVDVYDRGGGGDGRGPALGGMPMDLGGPAFTGARQGFVGAAPAAYFPDVPGQVILDANMDHFWTEIEKGWMNGAQGW